MQYANGPFSVILGKIPVATSITSADPYAPGHGAGAIATYKVNDNLTVGAAFVDALKNGANFVKVGNKLYPDVQAGVAIFNAGPVKGNVWAYHINKIVKHLFTVSLDAKPVDNLNVHFDYASSKRDGVKTSNYFNINAQYAMDAISAKIGFAKTNKGSSLISTSNDAPISAILPVEERYAITGMTDTKAYYGKFAYNVNSNANVYLGIAKVDQSESAGDDDSTEFQIGTNYKVNKKLGFNLFYDAINYDHATKTHYKQDKIVRAQAEYNF
jgi:hypothetical protein